MIDYRLSHLGKEKALSYHKQFAVNPYRSLIWEIERDTLTTLVARLYPDGVGSYLDFACGTGRVIGHLSGQIKNCLGVDVSPDMLEIASLENPDLQFISGDITSEPLLGDLRFDLITAFRFFPNAQPELRLACMKALAHNLDKGGILIFNNHKNRNSVIYRVGHILRGKRQTSMSLRECTELASAAGLVVESRYFIGVLPVTERYRFLPIWIIRIMERALSKIPLIRSLAHDIVFVCRKG